MISMHLTKKKLWDSGVEGYIFFLNDGFDLNGDFGPVEKHYPHLQELLKRHKFFGRKSDLFVLSAMDNGKLIQFIFVGVGKQAGPWNDELEILRRAVGRAVQTIKRLEIYDAAFVLPDAECYRVHPAELAKQMTIAACMTGYEFDKFKSDKRDKEWRGKLYLAVHGEGADAIEAAVNEGWLIAQSINGTRHIADLPANIATPKFVAAEAQKIAKEHNLKATIFGRDKAADLGMGGFLAVGSGSSNEPQFVVLEYAYSASAPTIALVGKGVCFDTGGVSLKPANSMTGMKYDCSGASAVINSMSAIATLKPHVNVIALAPLVENMPSGSAYRQDDIVTFMNGKTAEIKNTDAEGRVILADALAYAEKFYEPDVIIDVATLTGACSVALGHFFTALLTQDDDLAKALVEAGKLTGDRLWRLPQDDDFIEAIKSDVADIANTGSPAYGAGTITASFFLKNFVSKARWVHLDIAGTAHEVPGVNYLGKGATGASVRLIIEFVKNHAAKFRKAS